MSESVCATFQELPPPLDPERAARLMVELFGEGGQSQNIEDRRQIAELARKNPALMAMIVLIYDASPHVAGLMERFPTAALSIFQDGPEHVYAAGLANARNLDPAAGEAEIMRTLRQAKAHVSLAICIADLAGLWPVMKVTDALTRFADAALNGAVDWLLAQAQRSGKWQPVDAGNPSIDSGYVILAMGKHGAFELNYSSDIDLIVFYDPTVEALAEGTEASTFFVRVTRQLVKLLQDRTGDGYVFRVDLRLRPDPRATNVAIAIEAAAQYYETLGQNWERAAMIKARPAAGDIPAGEDFLKRLAPFVWRKYLDYSSIADVHSMKRQIHAFKGHGEIAVYGHNIKLGRGGIREIEFFVQTQQLIAGGRAPHLRGRETLVNLEVLSENDWITPSVAAEMREAYLFLRHVEHRLQMQGDDQTHVLPTSIEDMEKFARFAGFASRDVFAAQLLDQLNTVQSHYAVLFEHAPTLGNEDGSLVFTGGDDDPDTIETLHNMGFQKPSEISATIRGWHFGRYAATRSERAKEKLTELMPALLRALSETLEPDRAFLAFDRFLAGLPAGVQLFSLLWSNPNLLQLLAGIMGGAPRLASVLGQKPQVLDAVLDAGFFGPLPDMDEYRHIVADRIRTADSLELGLDLARLHGNEQAFRIGVQVLTGTASAYEVGRAYSDLAESEIAGLLDLVAGEIQRRHGKIAGGQAAVVAMGKLGGREMTAASDLDLMVIYDFDVDAGPSDGPKPLMGAQYFARLTQRLISALSAPTAEGNLYEVDMRLRPSGNSGPIATRLETFVDYQSGSAWTWEKLALTRARVIAGDADLGERVTGAIAEAIAQPRDMKETARDVNNMRQKIEQERGTKDPWEIKLVRGGLVDIEFIAQFLQIAHAHRHTDILSPNTAFALARLHKAGLLDDEHASQLDSACRLFQGLTQVLRLCVAGDFDAATAPDGLRSLLIQAGETPDFAILESTLTDVQRQVKVVYDQLVENVL